MITQTHACRLPTLHGVVFAICVRGLRHTAHRVEGEREAGMGSRGRNLTIVLPCFGQTGMR
jgi:hypothetical protein